MTIVEDGRILYAAAEERFTRVKLQTGFPWQALQDGLDRTSTQPGDFAVVAYPFLGWDEETRLFERNLQREREFLDDAENAATSAQIRQASTRVPARKGAIPGLREPNEKMEKGFAKTLAYAARERRRGLAERREAAIRPMGPRSVDLSSQVARGARRRARRAGTAEQAEARRASREPRGQRLLHQRLRRGADRDARRLRIRPRGQRQRRPRRTDRARARRRVSAFARHVLRVGDVGARLQAEPPRREDRRPGRLRRSGGAAGRAAVALSTASPATSASSRATTCTSRACWRRSSRRSTSRPRISTCSKSWPRRTSPTTCSRPGLGNLVLSGGVVANVKLNQRLRELPGVDRHLRPPEHGRRRLRHRRGAARVRRQRRR